MELFEYTAEKLSGMLREKKCSAAEIAESVFSRIRDVEDKVGAYITLTEEQAFEKAREVDDKIAAGTKISPLAGIPVGIKDNIYTKGIRTTCASEMMNDYVPNQDAAVTEKLYEADAVITGKLNMDEFAMGSSCETSYFKKTKNPHDLSRVPGGSSGGSAAAVASGEAVLALGTDTGGSIRIPASYCGVVGLKPSYGTVSRKGLVALAAPFDQIGTFGRCVKDAALLFDAVKGSRVEDPTCSNLDFDSVADRLDGNIAGLKIGIPAEYFDSGLDHEVETVLRRAAGEFEKQGAKLIPISLPSTRFAMNVYNIIACSEASTNLSRLVESGEGLLSYGGSGRVCFGEEVKRRIMLGTFVRNSAQSDAYILAANLTRDRICNEFDEAYQTCDVILTPTSPMTAFRLGERQKDPDHKIRGADRYTVPANLAGLPALSLPCGRDRNNLPVGMQLIGRKYDEKTIINTGYAYEQNNEFIAMPSLTEERTLNFHIENPK